MRRGYFLSIDGAAHYKWSVVCRPRPLFSPLLLILISSQDPLPLIILKASLQHCCNQYFAVDFHVTPLFWRKSLWNSADTSRHPPIPHTQCIYNLKLYFRLLWDARGQVCNSMTLKMLFWNNYYSRQKKLCKGVLYVPKMTLPLTFTLIYMPSHNIMPFTALMAPHSTTQTSSRSKGH